MRRCGATLRFPREVDEFGASEALRIGLVQAVVEPGRPIMASEDVQEGLRAFLERRAGAFKGR